MTGARRSEILGLEWQDVDLSRHIINLQDSKTREKVVYLSPPAAAILTTLPRLAGNPFVIAGAVSGRPYIGIDKVWHRVRTRAGLGDVRMHDLRHTFASFGASASLGLPIIGKLLGHTQAQTTARYSHLASDPVRRAADVLTTASRPRWSGSRTELAGGEGDTCLPIETCRGHAHSHVKRTSAGQSAKTFVRIGVLVQMRKTIAINKGGAGEMRYPWQGRR